MADGRLLLGATPLGQPSDASPRLVSALATADIVAAEDTRRLRTLAKALDVTDRGKVVSLFDQNEAARVPGLVEQIAAAPPYWWSATPACRWSATRVSVGGRLCRRRPAGDCLPGPSAVTTALAVSGLPSERFCFEGFAPRKQAARRDWLASLATEQRTSCSSSRRGGCTPACCDAVHGARRDARAAICRELTKVHEEVVRGSLDELAEWAADGVLGEITVVLAGGVSQADLPTLVAR